MSPTEGISRRPPPLAYLLHGDDEFEILRQLREWRTKVLDDNVGGLNVAELDGETVALDELVHHSFTPPFLGERRLITVGGIGARLQRGRAGAEEGEASKTFLEELQTRLSELPETTRLVFWERTRLEARHPLRKLISGLERGKVVDMLRPRGDRSYVLWVGDRMREKGGGIDSEAATRLVELVGNDKQQLDQEIEKLLSYADEGAVVTEADVEAVASRTREESIFDLVDAVGQGLLEGAIRGIRDLLDEGQSPYYLHHMLARQIRLILQTKDLAERKTPAEEIQSRLRQREFVIQKCLAQGRNFSFAQLERACELLLGVDVALKTGRGDEETSLYLLTDDLVRLARSRAPAGA